MVEQPGSGAPIEGQLQPRPLEAVGVQVPCERVVDVRGRNELGRVPLGIRGIWGRGRPRASGGGARRGADAQLDGQGRGSQPRCPCTAASAPRGLQARRRPEERLATVARHLNFHCAGPQGAAAAAPGRPATAPAARSVSVTSVALAVEKSETARIFNFERK